MMLENALAKDVRSKLDAGLALHDYNLRQMALRISKEQGVLVGFNGKIYKLLKRYFV